MAEVETGTSNPVSCTFMSCGSPQYMSIALRFLEELTRQFNELLLEDTDDEDTEEEKSVDSDEEPLTQVDITVYAGKAFSLAFYINASYYERYHLFRHEEFEGVEQFRASLVKQFPQIDECVIDFMDVYVDTREGKFNDYFPFLSYEL
jgi:hypothetical protein